MTLVSKRLRGKQLFDVSSSGGQCFAVNIGPLPALNSYAKLHRLRASLFTPAAGIGSRWNSSRSLTMSCPLVFKKAPTCTCWRKGF